MTEWKPSAMSIRARRNVMREVARDNPDLSREDVEKVREGYDADIKHPGAGRRWWRDPEGDLCGEVVEAIRRARQI
jgi:hypothetical protein